MNFVRYLFVLVVACTCFFSVAYSQEAIIVLDHKEIGLHERPLVHFTHEKHSANLECVRCHHDYDKYGNVKSTEGQACSDCHTPLSGKNPSSLTDALHFQCKSCHEDMRAARLATGPEMCGECHVRK